MWFHDAVYDPRRADNEAASADLAVRFLNGTLAPVATAVSAERLRELVLATSHKPPTAPPDADVAALLDADLAILGASPERYARYAADVRREFAHVGDADWRTGRARVMQSFLDRPSLYNTPIMVAEGEAAARRNLLAELAQFQTGSPDAAPPR